jgi:hypothetical protein
LEPGTNRFTLHFQHNGPGPSFGLNLFFDGSGLPGLSVKGPWRTGEAIPSFTANNARVSYSLTSYPTPNAPAAGTSSAVFSGRRVEVIDYYVAATNVFASDRVSTHQAVANGRLDYIATFGLVIGPRRPTRNIKIEMHVTEVTLCWESEVGSLYQVEFRSPGREGDWTALGQPIPGTGTTACTVDRVPLGQPQRFYRVTALE